MDIDDKVTDLLYVALLEIAALSYLMSVHKLRFFILSCPKPAQAVSKQGSVIGHPELIKKLDPRFHPWKFHPLQSFGERATECGNDGSIFECMNRL